MLWEKLKQWGNGRIGMVFPRKAMELVQMTLNMKFSLTNATAFNLKQMKGIHCCMYSQLAKCEYNVQYAMMLLKFGFQRIDLLLIFCVQNASLGLRNLHKYFCIWIIHLWGVILFDYLTPGCCETLICLQFSSCNHSQFVFLRSVNMGHQNLKASRKHLSLSHHPFHKIYSLLGLLGFWTLSIVRYSKNTEEHTGRWTKSKHPIVLNVIYHRQNPLKSTTAS
jgi:hypothetical protein